MFLTTVNIFLSDSMRCCVVGEKKRRKNAKEYEKKIYFDFAHPGRFDMSKGSIER